MNFGWLGLGRGSVVNTTRATPPVRGGDDATSGVSRHCPVEPPGAGGFSFSPVIPSQPARSAGSTPSNRAPRKPTQKKAPPVKGGAAKETADGDSGRRH